MTTASYGIDDPGNRSTKTSTTVAMDFGCVTIDKSLKLYLFGTPGQDRFAFLWDDLVDGALGAIVLVDTQRIEDSFPAIDYFEEHEIPFIIGVNRFDYSRRFAMDEVQDALGISDTTPLMECDARDRESVKSVLVALTEEVLTKRLTRERAATW